MEVSPPNDGAPAPRNVDELMLRLAMARGTEEILAVVREGVRPLIGADGVAFVLRDGDMCHYADEDAISPLWKGQRFPLETCISGWAMLNRQTAVIEDIYADERIPHEAYRPTFVRSLVMVPVRQQDPVAAIGAYWATRRRPGAAEVALLERIANGAAVAVTNVALLGSLIAARDDAERAKDAIVIAMAALAESRDVETGSHIRRTQHYVRALALACAERGGFDGALRPELIEVMFKSAPLHDIGKVGIPDRILLKPGRLDESEFEIMKTHARIGCRTIAEAGRQVGRDNSFLRLAREIAFTHHEKWDGGGYPRGLKGREIPLSGRLMALADVYDALVTERVYKQAIPHERAVGLVAAERGRHFDPELVDVFVAIAPQMAEIRERFAEAA